MQSTHEFFASIPGIVDVRDAPLKEVYDALELLRSANVSAGEAQALVDSLSLTQKMGAYEASIQESRSSHERVIRNLSNVTLRPYKQILGDDYYV